MTLVVEKPATIESAKNVPAEGYRSLLKNKAFMALWIGQVFSQIADRIIFVVFITLIVTHFGAQQSLKSYLYIAFTIPAILLTALAGVFIDRWDRKATLFFTNILRAGIVATIPWAIQSQSLLGLYACAFGISVVTQFFVPAESATIPAITRPTQLLVANSLFTTTMMASVIFGFALGDPLIQWFSIQEVHWAIVGLFLLAAVAISLIRIPPTPVCPVRESRLQALNSSWHRLWEEMKEGFQYLRETPAVWHKMLKLAILFSTIVSASFVFISLSESYLYTDPKIAAQKFSWLITFSGLGMVIGALWVGQGLRHVRKSITVYSGFSAMGIGLLAFLLIPILSQHVIAPTVFPYLDYRILFAHSMAIVLGISAAIVAVPLQSVLHELIPEDKRGKVMGVQFTLLSTCSTLPAIIVGYGADWFGVLPLFALIGFPLLIFGLKGLYDQKNNRQYDREGNDASTW